MSVNDLEVIMDVEWQGQIWATLGMMDVDRIAWSFPHPIIHPSYTRWHNGPVPETAMIPAPVRKVPGAPPFFTPNVIIEAGEVPVPAIILDKEHRSKPRGMGDRSLPGHREEMKEKARRHWHAHGKWVRAARLARTKQLTSSREHPSEPSRQQGNSEHETRPADWQPAQQHREYERHMRTLEPREHQHDSQPGQPEHDSEPARQQCDSESAWNGRARAWLAMACTLADQFRTTR
ncbi:hypothetical protein HGRIS_007346 [Hohenbuehelia grisea]|uniref:Uncharacterized protein n=1 Tax=Hohenbuehelia grisea TaxID=104357 RepID=A0ABR3J4H0_9AGAR